MIATDYIFKKIAAELVQPALPALPAPQAPAPPPPAPPPAVVGGNTAPAGAGAPPSTPRSYKDGPGDITTTISSFGNIGYSLRKHMEGDKYALKQFAPGKRLAQQGMIALASSMSKADWWDDNMSKIAGLLISDEDSKNLKIVADAKEKYGPYMDKFIGMWDEYGKPVEEWWNNTGKKYWNDYGKPTVDWLKKDYTGTGYFNNWKIGAGLLGAYGLYRMFKPSREDELEELIKKLREMLAQMAANNLYTQYGNRGNRYY